MTLDDLKKVMSEVASAEAQKAIEGTFERFESTQESWVNRLDSAISAAAAKNNGNAEPERGHRVAQMLRAVAAGKGDQGRALIWAQKHYPKSEELHKALSVSISEGGGFTVPPNWRAELIELFRPASVIRDMNPVVWPLTNGTATVPGLASGAAASYIGENRDIGITEQAFRQLNMAQKKLTALVPISNDLIRYSTPAADSVVRDDLVMALATRSDAAFIRDDGTQNTPKGLRYWAPAANVIPANATVNLANVTADLGKLVLALLSGDVRMLRPGFIMAPRTFIYLMTVRDGNGNYAFRPELLRGVLWNFPYKVTTNVPVNLGGGGDESELYFADFADVVIGEAQDLIIDISTEAAYNDGSGVVSSFQRDQTLIRAIEQHDFGMRHPESVAVLTAVKWIP